MTSTSGLKLPIRSEAEARRERAKKNMRDAAIRWGHDPDQAVAGLESAYAMKDAVNSWFGGVK